MFGRTFLALTLTAASAMAQSAMTPGVSIRMYDIGESMFSILPLVPGQTPNVSRIEPDLDMSQGDFAPMEEYFILIADGSIKTEQAGTYEFELISDDGSHLWISGTKVIDNDGLHGAESMTGSIDLEPGLHPFEVKYFNGPTDRRLTLRWRPPGAQDFTVIPTAALRCPGGEVRVTSPGRKKVMRPLQRAKPGDGRPLEGGHPSFDLVNIRPDDFTPRVGGMAMMSDGRLALCTWDPDGAVYLLDGIDGDADDVTVKRIAAGLAEPLGMSVVDDDIFVLQKQELTQLIDHNGDDIIDEYRVVCSGWPVSTNFHEFAFGLVYDNGVFYANLAIAIDPGGRSTDPQVPERGSVIAIPFDGTGEYDVIADGLRTPNGIGRGVDGEVFITDNQGDWVPVSKLVHLKRGAFYGSRAVLGDAAASKYVQPPAVWLPQGEIGNSPSNPAPLDVGPYAGQMIHGDVTHGGLKRVFLEKIGRDYQGAVFRFSQGFEAGVNRTLHAGDGRYFVGGIGSSGNWGQEGKARVGLARFAYNGEATFEMLAVRAMTNGMEIEFTSPLAPGVGWDPSHVYVEQYRYEPTINYGGPKLDRTVMNVTSSTVSEDRTRVSLEIDGLEEDRVVYLRLVGPWAAADGKRPWSTEAWYTLNMVPTDREIEPGEPVVMPQNLLTAAERAAGWELLFDGERIDHWRGFRKDAMPEGWVVEDGCIHRNGHGGDIITKAQYENFELALEWKVQPGGNSGIFFNVSEDAGAVWEFGPEMQVLDNERHNDGGNPLTSAGANYALHAPKFDASYPAGVFNRARLYVRDGHVEHWLNGHKIVEYQLGSEDWKKRVAASKFANMPNYGTTRRGHIALQDHQDLVWYRNIKIRRID